jgi:uncharacterized membrane protein YecN with MAPEG domain
MTDIPVALATAGILGLLFVYLSVRVTMARAKTKISVGDDAQGTVMLGREADATPLQIACRAQANCAEYVPIALIAARIAHPIGMTRKAPNPFRAGGALLTWVMIVLAGLDALRIAI